MESLPVTKADKELIEFAREKIRQLFAPRKHHIAAALRASSGKVYTGVHLEAHVGRAAVCAEAAALATAISAGEKEFDTIVAVRHPRDHEESREIKVVSPCGICRELLSDYSSDLKVIFAENGETKKALLLDLFPHKYDH